MESIEGYSKLEIYQLAHSIGVNIHQFSLKLPKHELYEIGNQLRRASKSISANIVEGYGRRRYKAEFMKFLVYALASCDETVEWLQYVKDCYAEHSTKADEFLNSTNELGKKINRFLQSVGSFHSSPK